MQAPSTNLLRALRRATSSLATAPVTKPQSCYRQACLRVQRYPSTQRPRPSALRAFSTTPWSHEPSPSSASHPHGPPSSTNASSPPSSRRQNPYAPSSNRSRGPASKEETQTDFSLLDIYASAGVEQPATSIDACTLEGFHLNNGVVTSGGRGVMLLGGEGFVWSPWNLSSNDASGAGAAETQRKAESKFTQFLTRQGTLHFPTEAFGLLTLLYPKPDLLIFGTGQRLHMLSKDTRAYLSEQLGVKVDVMDTANASAAYNLLIMERGVEGVGAILIPEGFKGQER